MVRWVCKFPLMIFPSTLFSDEDVGGDHRANYRLASSVVAGDSTFPALITLKMKVTTLNRGETRNFIKT